MASFIVAGAPSASHLGLSGDATSDNSGSLTWRSSESCSS